MSKGDGSLISINNQQAPMGFVLCVAYIGAVVYFFNQQPDFWGFILALLKAIVWPAFMVFHGLRALGV